MKEFLNSLANLQRRIHMSKESPDSLESETDVLGQEFILLHKFINQNSMGFSKIAKKHDKKTGLASRPWLEARLSYGESFILVKFDILIVGISDVYSRIRKLRETIKKQREGTVGQDEDMWVPPQSFERKTTKYWVEPENLLAVKIMIVKQLPVLIFGRKDEGKPPRLESGNSEFKVGDSSPITSIYLDNANLDLYHRRINREEGAQLIRLRWYGQYTEAKSPSQVFVERKTHHEAWIENESVKERFPIKWKNVWPYLNSNWNPQEKIQKKVANGEMKESEAAGILTLSAEVQKKLSEMKLLPMVRTVYNRSAFQLASTNAVRISIDTDLVMMNEQTSKPVGKWILEGKDIPTSEKVNFRQGILEIKLQDTPPEWIHELLDTGYLTEVTKFSKFLNGCCQLHPEKVKVVPHWHTPETIAALQDKRRKQQQRENDPGYLYDDGTDSNTSGEDETPEATVVPTSNHKAVNSDVQPELIPLMEHSDDEPPSRDRRRKKKSRSGSRDDAPWIERCAGDLTQSCSACWSWITSCGRHPEPPPDPKKSHVPVRVEPKTYFANERTFIQWLSASLFLTTLSIGLISLGSITAQYAGLLIFPVVFFFIFYSLYQYTTRLRAIQSREKMRFDDKYGPPILASCVLLSMIIIVSMYWAQIFYATSPDPAGTINNPDSLTKWVTPTSECYKLDTSHLVRFFSPSGLAIHAATNTLWLSSRYQIASIYIENNNVTKTYPVPNYDINGIATVPDISDRVYLAVEWKDNNGIAEYSITSEAVTRLWVLTDVLGDLPIAGGLAYSKKSTTTSSSALFYLPTNDGLVGVELPVYEDPKTNDTTYKVVDSLPVTRYMVGTGNDTKIEGVDFVSVTGSNGKVDTLFYTLFTHMKKVRGWNYATGAEVGEFSLPGKTDTWGGITFSEDVLSYDPNSIWFYGCLGSPAEVWRFKWNTKSGFPSCA